jgi:hypothetical protein
MLPACTFASTPKPPAGPFDPRLLRSVRFRGRIGARSTPGTRYPQLLSTLSVFHRSPLPIGSSYENPPDHSVRPVPSRKVRLAERPMIPCYWLLPLLNSAADQRPKLASSRSAYRSVNPGTKSRIVECNPIVKLKNNASRPLSTTFSAVVFQWLSGVAPWIFCA